MNRFDDAMREALKREEPAADFTRRVLARVEAIPVRTPWWRMPVIRLASAAAVVLLLVAGVRFEREREVRIEGEHAKRQVMVAFRIAGSKLQLAQQMVREVNDKEKQ